MTGTAPGNALTGESIEAIAAKFGASGYVVDSIPLALFAARLIEIHPLDQLLIMVIEAGGDTDTNAFNPERTSLLRGRVVPTTYRLKPSVNQIDGCSKS